MRERKEIDETEKERERKLGERGRKKRKLRERVGGKREKKEIE